MSAPSTADRSVDVVVIGGGLAGLGAARALVSAGLQVAVLEKDDAVGGRVRSDVVDGVTLDRGFQLLNPTYPEVRRVVDVPSLHLQPFEAGAVVAHGDGRFVAADPRRAPRDALATLRLPLGSLREKVAFTRWAAEIGFGPAGRIKTSRDMALGELLRGRGLNGPLTEGILRPFLAGVLAESSLETSAVFAQLLVRSFVRGTPALPRQGIQALPNQLAHALPSGTVQLNCAVHAVHSLRVESAVGTVAGRAVVVASDPVSAASLTGAGAPEMRGLTTFYFLAPEPPTRRGLLHLDADRRGPVVNTAVLTNTVPDYAPGRHLVAATVLGADASSAMALAARTHAGLIFGVNPVPWELIASYPIAHALPSTPAGTALRKPVRLGGGIYVAGDHRDTASIQGALVSGRRAAQAVLSDLR